MKPVAEKIKRLLCVFDSTLYMVSSITSPSDRQFYLSHIPPSTRGSHSRENTILLFPQKTDYRVSVASDLKKKKSLLKLNLVSSPEITRSVCLSHWNNSVNYVSSVQRGL